MAGRYEQLCAVAAALDSVGDRWTLLVVRELLAGPRRYGELQAGLPGIATNLLAARLRHLEAEGLVHAVDVPDGRGRAYALTPDGQGLREVLEALTRFGLPRVRADDDGRAFLPRWLELPVGAVFRPEALTGDLVVRFEVEGADGAAQLHLSRTGWRRDDGAHADVVVAGSPATLLAAVRSAAEARSLRERGLLTVTGSRADRQRLAAALGGAAADAPAPS